MVKCFFIRLGDTFGVCARTSAHSNQGIESVVTRCVIAIMAVVQLIFLTETGVVILGYRVLVHLLTPQKSGRLCAAVHDCF